MSLLSLNFHALLALFPNLQCF